MRAARRLFASFALGFLVVSIPAVAKAENYALLVGVSDYPLADHDLKGPPNDIALMWNVLTERDFDPSNIAVLADSMERKSKNIESSVISQGLPTRAAILASLEELAGKAQFGDFVYIHFSGHGAMQPDVGELDEPDQLDEIFLPIDIGQWDSEIQRVENAIIDDELAPILARMNKNGASVWAVFDQCNAGTAARGGADIQARAVSPETLGIPLSAVSATRGGGTHQDSEPALGSGNIVAFYAVHPGEAALERRLPSGKIEGAQPNGVFTWAIASALVRGGIESYRDLARAVQQTYRGLSSGTPLFEGDLDQRIFSQSSVARKLTAVASQDGLVLEGGFLEGVAEGAVLALYPLGSDSDAEPLGHVLAYDVTANSAALTPDARDGRKGVDTETLPSVTEARFVERPLDLTLRVAAVEPDALGQDPIGRKLRTAIAAFAGGSVFSPAAAARIEWVGPGDDPDYLLERIGDRLAFVDRVAETESTGRATVPTIELPGSGRVESAARLAQRIARALQRLAKARNIFSYAEMISPDERIGKHLVIDAFIYREPRPLPLLRAEGPADNRHCRRFNQRRVLRDMNPVTTVSPRAGHCDVLVFRLRNEGEKVIDVTGLYVDRGGGVSALHAAPENPARLHPKGPPAHMFAGIGTWDTRANAPMTLGRENVAFIALEQPLKAPERADFRLLAQASLAATERGATKGGISSSFATQLLTIAFPDGGVTKGNRPSFGKLELQRAEIRTYSIRVVAP